MKLHGVAWLLAATSLAAGCSHPAPATACNAGTDLTVLRSLQPASAENDARHSFARGDHKLIGINAGVGFEVPELAGDPFKSGYELRAIDINDVSCNPEEHQIRIDARNYVRQYNRQMMLLYKPRKNTSAIGLARKAV